MLNIDLNVNNNYLVKRPGLLFIFKHTKFTLCRPGANRRIKATSFTLYGLMP